MRVPVESRCRTVVGGGTGFDRTRESCRDGGQRTDKRDTILTLSAQKAGLRWVGKGPRGLFLPLTARPEARVRETPGLVREFRG